MRQLHEEYAMLSVRTLAHWLGLSRSWYYARVKANAAREAPMRSVAGAEATALRDAIERIVLDFPGYGYRRVTQALRRAGVGPINHKRVLRVMREESLLCQLKRRFVVTTDSAHGCRTYPNLLKGGARRAVAAAQRADRAHLHPGVPDGRWSIQSSSPSPLTNQLQGGRSGRW